MIRDDKPVEGYCIIYGEGEHQQDAIEDLQKKVRQAEMKFEIIRGYGGPFIKETDHPKNLFYATQALQLRAREQG